MLCNGQQFYKAKKARSAEDVLRAFFVLSGNNAKNLIKKEIRQKLELLTDCDSASYRIHNFMYKIARFCSNFKT